MKQISKHISYKDCKFACEKDRESTARIVVFKELNIINSYTIEASFYKSEHKALKKIRIEYEQAQQGSNFNTKKDAGTDEIDDHFEESDFMSIGKDFIKSIALGILNPVLKKVFIPEFIELTPAEISSLSNNKNGVNFGNAPDAKNAQNQIKSKSGKPKIGNHKSVTREHSMPADDLSKPLQFT